MSKKETNVIVEEVYSPVDDAKMGKNIMNSTVWDLCFKKEEATEELIAKHPKMFVYTVKFDGLTPIQVTKIKQIR